jgi:pilus assembly protein CpaB
MVNTTDNKDKSVSRIVLSRILVLAVAQEANRDETKPKVVNAVTLEVAPDEAEKIDLARSIGTLSLVLRNPIDKAAVETTGVRRDDLLAKESAVPTVPTVPTVQARVVQRPWPKARTAALAQPVNTPFTVTVEVIRGVQKANSEF